MEKSAQLEFVLPTLLWAVSAAGLAGMLISSWAAGRYQSDFEALTGEPLVRRYSVLSRRLDIVRVGGRIGALATLVLLVVGLASDEVVGWAVLFIGTALLFAAGIYFTAVLLVATDRYREEQKKVESEQRS